MAEQILASRGLRSFFGSLDFGRDSAARGGAVVEALRYKPEGRVFYSRWCHWNILFI
jgi:hypothetical protein